MHRGSGERYKEKAIWTMYVIDTSTKEIGKPIRRFERIPTWFHLSNGVTDVLMLEADRRRAAERQRRHRRARIS